MGDVTSDSFMARTSAESREERPSSGVMTSSSNDVMSMSVLKSATGLAGTQLPVFQWVFSPEREMYFLVKEEKEICYWDPFHEVLES